jgi:hypothetical protein
MLHALRYSLLDNFRSRNRSADFLERHWLSDHRSRIWCSRLRYVQKSMMIFLSLSLLPFRFTYVARSSRSGQDFLDQGTALSEIFDITI